MSWFRKKDEALVADQAAQSTSASTGPGADHVPDAVLDELSAAFAEENQPSYDFDDPSIDRLLGIDDDLPDDELDDDELDDDDVDDDALAPTQPAPRPVAAETTSRRTIVIPEAEQPDTVSLDEDQGERFRSPDRTVDASGERSTIVISDLDEGRVVENAPSRGPGGMDPRMRARRIAARRAEGRKRLVWVSIAAGVLLVLVAVVAVVASPLFDVRTVNVQGAVYTDHDVLQQVIDSMKGHAVLLVDTAKMERELEAVPWVESARVTTDFPHTVTIDIRERNPIATFEGGDQQFRVIDAQGRVLDVIAGQPIAYTLITGANPDTARGQFAGAPYAAAAQLVVALPAEIRSITQSVGVDAGTGTLSMQLKATASGGGKTHSVEVRLGNTDTLDEKLARLLQQVREGLDGVTAIDVSTAEVGVVRG